MDVPATSLVKERENSMPDKLSLEFQTRFSNRLIFDQAVFRRIDPSAKLNEHTEHHPLSSSAACLNVIGSISREPAELQKFLASFGLEVEEVYEFHSGFDFGGLTYRDEGFVIFEWIGPKVSPINEDGSNRGQMRTSVDAFLLGRVNGRATQILIEWKFTEGQNNSLALGKFCGGQGVERLTRYARVLADLRHQHDLPFDFEEEDRARNSKLAVGLYDFSPDHMYQLLRMTLLAKMTIGMKLGDHTLEDYRIVHLTHSQNAAINILDSDYLVYSPGLQQFSGKALHEVWRGLLSAKEKEKFVCGHWDNAINILKDGELRAYLTERYA